MGFKCHYQSYELKIHEIFVASQGKRRNFPERLGALTAGLDEIFPLEIVTLLVNPRCMMQI